MKNIGIYYLDFNGLYYIGRSNNLKRRYNDHISNLIKGISNYKMQKAYVSYGTPLFGILEYCEIDELADKEISWIEEFNAIEEGLNITTGGDGGGSGTTHNRSIHSKEVLYSVLKLLVDTSIYTYTEISKITGVSVSTITNITDSSSHVWLKDMYNEEYTTLLNNTTLREDRKAKALSEAVSKIKGIKKTDFKYPNLLDPFGIIYTDITNTKVFAEEHGLSTEGICKLCSGKIKSHRKWKLA